MKKEIREEVYGRIILVRHGESVWNRDNRFTGWVDVPLSSRGVEEARHAADLLKDIRIDCAFVSHLTRAVQTLFIMLPSLTKKTPIIHHHDNREMEEREHYSGEREEFPIYQSPAIAERYYGKLQGLNKKKTAEKYGEEQVRRWRRSFSEPPPGGESLKDTLKRVLPYFKDKIIGELGRGENVLVVAHGNSLRAIATYLEELPPDEVMNLEIPTGVPIIYEFDRGLKMVGKRIRELPPSQHP